MLQQIACERGNWRWLGVISIAVLALCVVSLVVPMYCGALVDRSTDRARVDLALICDSITRFVRERERLPTSWSELIERDANGQRFLDTPSPPPLDPWRRPYIYEPDFARRTWLVKSLGRDGELGGSGDDADIICEGSIDGVKSLTNPRAGRPTDR